MSLHLGERQRSYLIHLNLVTSVATCNRDTEGTNR